MAARKSAKSPRKTSKSAAARPAPVSMPKRAAISRSGATVRLPQDCRFPHGVKDVRIRRQGDSIVISPVRTDWSSFFCLEVEVPEELLERRGDPPQVREPL